MTRKPQPITRAYRTDLGDRGDPFGESDDAWLAAGSLLAHAAMLLAEHPEEAPALVSAACARAVEAISQDRLAELRERDWADRGISSLDALLLLSDYAYDAGAPHVAASLQDGILAACPELDTLARGRILAWRARSAWRLGWLGEAQDRLADLRSLGEREREPELVARAWAGEVALAQMRGNYPDMERCAREAEAIATRIRHTRLVRISRISLMIVASVRKDFDAALNYAWAVYEASAGSPLDVAETLTNIGQVLLEAGYPDAARAAFAKNVSQPLPARYHLPALGGLALASAQTKRVETVRWATAQVSGFDLATTAKYPLAYALLECACACDIVGETAKAEAARARAGDIAARFHFHEIAYHATERVVPASPLGAPATTVAREVVALEPARLPDRVALVSVG